jgi:hypothetical protein
MSRSSARDLAGAMSVLIICLVTFETFDTVDGFFIITSAAFNWPSVVCRMDSKRPVVSKVSKKYTFSYQCKPA